jgi:chromodomain-helicase-DNA-binding protein 7
MVDMDASSSSQEIPREKKRKKLDEIVFGLNAAKTSQDKPTSSSQLQKSLFSGLERKSQPGSSFNPSQLLSTMSLLTSPSKDFARNLSAHLASAQKKSDNDNTSRQQDHASELARLAELGVPKFDFFSHDAKVNKWLAEHANLPPEGSTSPEDNKRRRKPRTDPLLMDWAKLTGDENISVVHRVSGKKV